MYAIASSRTPDRHHHLHADASPAGASLANRVSGVTTRFVAPTVRILRLDVVKTNGRCDKWVWQSSVTLLAPERFAPRGEASLDTKRGRFVAAVRRFDFRCRLQHDCCNLVWQSGVTFCLRAAWPWIVHQLPRPTRRFLHHPRREGDRQAAGSVALSADGGEKRKLLVK